MMFSRILNALRWWGPNCPDCDESADVPIETRQEMNEVLSRLDRIIAIEGRGDNPIERTVLGRRHRPRRVSRGDAP